MPFRCCFDSPPCYHDVRNPVKFRRDSHFMGYAPKKFGIFGGAYQTGGDLFMLHSFDWPHVCQRCLFVLGSICVVLVIARIVSRRPSADDTLDSVRDILSSQTGAVEYGQSGCGRPLYAYAFGGGTRVMILTFAMHGYEDAFPADGAALVLTACQLMDVLSESEAALTAADWTVWVLPCLNPDGLLEGRDNNGPGRCTIASLDIHGALQISGVDLNRCFPEKWEKQQTPRNANGDAPLACPEAAALADFLQTVYSTNRSVCIDVHGWYGQTITSDSENDWLFRTFRTQFPENTWANYRNGSGYLTAYAAALGYDACLFEFPGPVHSLDAFLAGDCIDRFLRCIRLLLTI